MIAAAYDFVVMPNLDGGDGVSRLKTDPKLKDIPVAAPTATVRKAEVDSLGGIMGGFPLIGKPGSAQQLIASIYMHKFVS